MVHSAWQGVNYRAQSKRIEGSDAPLHYSSARLQSEGWIASVAAFIIGPAKGRTRWLARNDEI
jgi:hypothetical protein